MNVPDRIFAVGGAGKEISLTLLEQEWLIEDVLEPRPNPESLTVTIIDSAAGEENADRERIQSIRNRINELENELQDDSDNRTGTVDLEYKLVTENIQLNSSIDLVGEETVPRIAEGTGMEQEKWWLKENHINENLDFARGVVRKRGLGKALYYKAYAEDAEMSSIIDLPEKGKVAMIAGLGGGTGSGIMIDVAQHIQDSQPTAEITLFGILPNHFEGVEENTNAYAALSELEYLSLTGENTFKDIMLFPIDPTGFDGKTGHRIQSEAELRQFDEALVYLLMSYYHTDEAGLEDPFQSSPQYAPFTIAIPQVLRYNIESINKAREAIRDILDRKREALEAEEEIYSQINRFLDRHYEEESESSLRDLDQTDLTKRIENVESLLDFDLFDELEYHSRTVFSEIVSDAEQESNSIEERIDLMDAQVRAVDASSQEVGNFVDDVDELLAEILEKELSLLAERKALFTQRKVIEDSLVRDTVEHLMSTDDDDQSIAGVQLQRLESKLEDIRERRERLESELEETTEELEELREQQRDEIESHVNRWQRDIRESAEQLQRINNLSVESLLDDLHRNLEQFNNNVQVADDEEGVEEIPEQDVISVLDQLEQELDSIGMDIGDERAAIEGSLSELKRVRIAQLQVTKEEGTLENILPWKSSTEETKEEALKEFRMTKNQIEDKNVFSIGPPQSNFSSEVVYNGQNILDEVERREEELKSEITSKLRERLDNEDNPNIGELRNTLEGEVSIDRLSEVARQGFEVEITDTQGVEERKEEIEEELDEVVSQIDIYESTLELFNTLKQPRTTYSEHLSAYHTLRNEYDEESDKQVTTTNDDYVYVKNIQPDNVFRATGSDNLANSDLFSSQSEARRLQTQLEELAKNARTQHYTGLRRRKFSSGRTRYEDLKVRVGIVSPAVTQIDPEVLDFEDTFSGAFDLGASGQRIESPYTSWQGEFGGAWDIALTVFIDGVFLDNIRKVVQADGYRSSYLDREKQIGRDILVHHSFGLEEGYYVRRRDILNLENEEDIQFYLNNETEEITEKLLQHHTDVVETASPDPMGDDEEVKANWEE